MIFQYGVSKTPYGRGNFIIKVYTNSKSIHTNIQKSIQINTNKNINIKLAMYTHTHARRHSLSLSTGVLTYCKHL